MPFSVISPEPNEPYHFAQWIRKQIRQDIALQLDLFALLDMAKFNHGSPLDSGPSPCLPELNNSINLYGDLAGTALADIGPRLFRVDDGDLESWVGEACKTNAISFIAAAVQAQGLAEHLQSLREVTLPDGAQALFRFQDTHVTAHLWPLLTPGQSNQVLGPTHWWATPDTCGSWHVLTAAKGYQRKGALRFERKQYDALNEQLLVYTLAEQARETDPSLLQDLTACQRTILLRSRLKAASELGLTLQSDRALYVLLSLQLPAGFEQEEPFAGALARNRQGQQTFGDALDQVPASQWRKWNDKLDPA